MNPNHSIIDGDRERVTPRTNPARSAVLQYVRGENCTKPDSEYFYSITHNHTHKHKTLDAAWLKFCQICATTVTRWSVREQFLQKMHWMFYGRSL